MSAKACGRVWQVEAVWDGCLSASDAESLERHLESCAECRRERAQLQRLSAVAERLPLTDATPLQRRSLRQQLLRSANQRVVDEPLGFWRSRGVALALSLAALLCVGFGVARWNLRGPAVESAAARVAEPAYSLQSGPSSRFRVLEHGRTLRLGCDEGRLEIAVHKLEAGQRFFVTLPDGELEVRGTRFVFEVSGERTQRLSVSEGRVALRLRGRPEMSFGAGQAWSVSEPAPEPPQLTPVPSASAASLRPAPRARASARAPAVDAPETRRAPSEAEDFAAAMAAFAQSDFGTAEQLLTSFEQRYPRSAHREDVLFLRAVCRQRRGDVVGAQALAREYLRLFPEAFRAPEARRLASP